MTTLRQIGEKLRVERMRKKLPKTALAERCGVHRNTLQQLESGHANVELNTLIAICDALELSIQLVPMEVEDHIDPAGGINQTSLMQMITARLARHEMKDKK